VLLVIVASYIGPTAGYIEAWRLANETRSEVEQLRSENESLRQRARRLATPAAEEREARKAGMARPGERVYVVRGLPQERSRGR
jgi:cell division protein FtsB